MLSKPKKANKKTRPFLKWAGGKYAIVEEIQKRLPNGKRFVEPFMGAGSVFLNSDFEEYLLNDINPDLIAMYNFIKNDPETFVNDAKVYFQDRYNTEENYYKQREKFNKTKNRYKRALLFLYMNRHGYNGLCRYNKSGGFNVPFGRYKKPYFPEKELYFFAEKAKKATFTCTSYQNVFLQLKADDVVYCDPPYVALSQSAQFTAYTMGGFSNKSQADLATHCEQAPCPVLISNHNTELTQSLYKNAKCDFFAVSRTISSKISTRKKVSEIFALFS
jgi:DNA adenine methylase